MHKIGKESLDQSRVLALSLSETDVSPFSYELYEYHDQSKLQVQDLKIAGRNILSLIHASCLNMYRLQYNLLDEQNYSKATNTDLIGGQAPS